MKKLPQISIVIITLNNSRTIEKCLKSIMSQDYPKDLIEYLNVDGGSADSTTKILKQYGFKTITSPIKKNAEAQRAIGLAKAKNNLIVSLDADNYLPHVKWLKKMIQPFREDEKIVHAGSLHYTYRSYDTIFNRYCSLFGVLDPVVFYVGRPDRLPQYQKTWQTGRIVMVNKNYSVVEFTQNTLPTVGCNGVVYRKDILMKYAKVAPNEFFHIDIFADLVENGFNRFAVVHDSIIHDTAVDLRFLLQKRIHFLNNYYLADGGKRRYFIFNPKKIGDVARLFLFTVYTVTFVKPVYDSFKGFLKIKDSAWFIHPLMCWVYLWAYSLATMKRIYRKLYEKSTN